MRKVTPSAAPAVLVGEGSRGVRETERAIKLYAVKKNAKKAFKYAVYSDQTVKDELNRLFHFKCAYCESYFGGVHPVDVEHYRPKGGYVADNKLVQPGYYWLAADWSNLLPSCIDCNRERTQRFDDVPPELAGKANKFPLASEKRAKAPGEEQREKPLLLNPYLDEPDEHLRYDEEGNIQAVKSAAGRRSRKGKASIEVYGLRRTGLVQDRERYALQIRAMVERVEELLEIFDETQNEQLATRISEEMRLLKGYIDETYPYSTMARQLVEPFAQKHDLP